MAALKGPTPWAHGALRAIDQFIALCLVSHPRSHRHRGRQWGPNAVRLVWELVRDTRRLFAVGPSCLSCSMYWLIKFEVSPLVLGILGVAGHPAAIATDEMRAKFRLIPVELEWGTTPGAWCRLARCMTWSPAKRCHCIRGHCHQEEAILDTL
ncbi:hypothetical protein Pelo_18398 [Pelomyxa schiedti]|nr:hypothetical protein Pelo_18398 [Pelomyxa schiedti]